MKANFKKELTSQAPIDLITVISSTSEKQKGNAFEAFIDLINRHSKQINKLTVIYAGRLHSHYETLLPSNADQNLMVMKYDLWVETYTPYLKKLKIPYIVSDWNLYKKQESYNKYFDEIKLDFNEDDNCIAAIETLIAGKARALFKKYKTYKISYQQCREATINYLMEECAIFRIISDIHKYSFITYPNSLNDGLLFTKEKYCKNKITYLEYNLNTKSNKIIYSAPIHQQQNLGSLDSIFGIIQHGFFCKTEGMSIAEQVRYKKKLASVVCHFFSEDNLENKKMEVIDNEKQSKTTYESLLSFQK